MKIDEVVLPSKQKEWDDYGNRYGGMKDISSEKIEEIFSFIDVHCSDFLKAKAPGKFLYRGIHTDKDFFLGSSPTDRKSMGQGVIKQKVLDTFLTRSGFTSLRSNSICTTPSRQRAAGWDTPYYIFPINGFSFAWSPKIDDIGGDYDLYTWLKTYVGKAITGKDLELFEAIWQYSQTDLSGAMLSGHEITIHGNYVAVNERRFQRDVARHFRGKE
jgi:hypothetical protein